MVMTTIKTNYSGSKACMKAFNFIGVSLFKDFFSDELHSFCNLETTYKRFFFFDVLKNHNELNSISFFFRLLFRVCKLHRRHLEKKMTT